MRAEVPTAVAPAAERPPRRRVPARTGSPATAARTRVGRARCAAGRSGPTISSASSPHRATPRPRAGRSRPRSSLTLHRRSPPSVGAAVRRRAPVRAPQRRRRRRRRRPRNAAPAARTGTLRSRRVDPLEGAARHRRPRRDTQPRRSRRSPTIPTSASASNPRARSPRSRIQPVAMSRVTQSSPPSAHTSTSRSRRSCNAVELDAVGFDLGQLGAGGRQHSVGAPVVGGRQQLPDLGEREAQRLGPADEPQPGDIRIGVLAVLGAAAHRPFEEPAALVVANRLDADAGLPGQVPDRERAHPTTIPPVPRYGLKPSAPLTPYLPTARTVAAWTSSS